MTIRTPLSALLAFVALVAAFGGCGDPDGISPLPPGDKAGFEIGQVWSYADPPNQFGSEFHVIAFENNQECGPIALIALEDLRSIEPWAYIWFSTAYLARNRGQRVDVAPAPTPANWPQAGCQTQHEGLLAKDLEWYDTIRRSH